MLLLMLIMMMMMLMMMTVIMIVVRVFIQPRVPSFLSLDTDGRVLRLDSFSKTMGGG